ncbi:hypothetical protein E3N88_34163 [Mikania micrantha]|uniref:ATP-dependent DNA ligase family profile domain-containing protein n=1 Tax=Mikania micrantha TaxID=192012 RepID=A0A5N6MDW2_9ASTR|nr:hypothetical protein E3N88_34163 [Mikania micrantha]
MNIIGDDDTVSSTRLLLFDKDDRVDDLSFGLCSYISLSLIFFCLVQAIKKNWGSDEGFLAATGRGGDHKRRWQYTVVFFCSASSSFSSSFRVTIRVEMDDACLANEATVTKMNHFFEDAFHSSCEGIMVKSLDVEAGYLPSKRSDSWLKEEVFGYYTKHRYKCN